MKAQVEQAKPKIVWGWILRKERKETLADLFEHVHGPWTTARTRKFLQQHGYNWPDDPHKAEIIRLEAEQFSLIMNVILSGLARQNMATPEVKKALHNLTAGWLNGPAQVILVVTPDAHGIEEKLKWQVPNRLTPQGFLSTWQREQAHRLVEMVSSGATIKRCSAGDCQRFFVDSSPGGTGKFCSLTCQERIKKRKQRAKASTG
jgi:hypothetical protein